MDVLGDIREGQIETTVQGHLGCVSVLTRAHVLGVFDRSESDIAGGSAEATETNVVRLGRFAEF